MSSPEAALLVGVAEILDANTSATYRPEDAYLPGETPVVFGDVFPETGPAVALTIYNVEQVDRSSSRYWIQARIRTTGDPLDLDLVQEVHDALAWRRHPPMPDGIEVVQIAPGPYARLGRVGGVHLYSRNFSALT